VRQRERTTCSLEPLLWVAIPFFFVTIGVQAEWRALTEPAAAWLLAGLLTVGTRGQALGGALGALGIPGTRERWLIGFGMVSRGEVALVIATLGSRRSPFALETRTPATSPTGAHAFCLLGGPVFGLVMGGVFFAEEVTPAALAGIGLSLVGIYLVSRPPVRKPGP
jgi:hypothetical protein